MPDLRSALPPAVLQKRLLAMLQWLDEKLTEANIPYWITGGTLLGSLRHQGFIPHDDDIDIELLETDLPRAQEVLGAVGKSYRGLGHWTNSDVAMGRFFFWGTDGRFSESVDVFLRERPLRQLEEFPSEDEAWGLVLGLLWGQVLQVFIPQNDSRMCSSHYNHYTRSTGVLRMSLPSLSRFFHQNGSQNSSPKSVSNQLKHVFQWFQLEGFQLL